MSPTIITMALLAVCAVTYLIVWEEKQEKLAHNPENQSKCKCFGCNMLKTLAKLLISTCVVVACYQTGQAYGYTEAKSYEEVEESCEAAISKQLKAAKLEVYALKPFTEDIVEVVYGNSWNRESTYCAKTKYGTVWDADILSLAKTISRK